MVYLGEFCQPNKSNLSIFQTSPLAVSDALQGLWSRIRWNKPPKGFEKFFKDKPASAPKQEPAPPRSSAPKEGKEAAPKSSGGSGASPKIPPPKGGAQSDFSKFFKNTKAKGFGGGDGDKQKYATMAAVGTGALLLYLFADQMSYKEITWKDFVRTYLAKGHVSM
jgi:AFG3 family protein